VIGKLVCVGTSCTKRVAWVWGVGTEGARVAGAGTIIRARACGARDALVRITTLVSASQNKGVDTSSNVGSSVRIRLVPLLRRNVGKCDIVVSRSNGGSSKNDPITGYFPGVIGARVWIRLHSIDVHSQISTQIRVVVALIIAEGLV